MSGDDRRWTYDLSSRPTKRRNTRPIRLNFAKKTRKQNSRKIQQFSNDVFLQNLLIVCRKSRIDSASSLFELPGMQFCKFKK